MHNEREGAEERGEGGDREGERDGGGGRGRGRGRGSEHARARVYVFMCVHKRVCVCLRASMRVSVLAIYFIVASLLVLFIVGKRERPRHIWQSGENATEVYGKRICQQTFPKRKVGQQKICLTKNSPYFLLPLSLSPSLSLSLPL